MDQRTASTRTALRTLRSSLALLLLTLICVPASADLVTRADWTSNESGSIRPLVVADGAATTSLVTSDDPVSSGSGASPGSDDDPPAIPEPGAIALGATGLVMLFLIARRSRK